jgi:HPt (histidine-containing phosphotransfer) domain-containing protein
MEIQWNSAYIDLKNLINLSRGDKDRMLKYLNQFQDLIPSRVESLKNSLEVEDRKMVRQILHQMSPQLQFFGIPEVVIPIRRLEHEYKTIPIENLKMLVNDILIKLDHANKEVALVLKNYY